MVTATHAANTRATPERTAQVLFDPETLPLQSPGARVLSVESSWPTTGSKMTFKVMGATVEARVSENRLPEALTLVIQSSAATTTVHHQFVRLPDGGTRLEKTITMADGLLNRVMMALFLRRQLRGEVERGMKLANERASS
jgi:hypothetical protein